MGGTLEQDAKISLAGDLVDALGGCVAKGKHGNIVHVAVVRGEDRLALYAQHPQVCYDVGHCHDLAACVCAAFAVKVNAVFVADGVELGHVEKLRKRFVSVWGGEVGGDDLVSASPISGGFHFVFLLFCDLILCVGSGRFVRCGPSKVSGC